MQQQELEQIRVEIQNLRRDLDKLRIWQAYVLGAASAVGALISIGIMIAGKLIR